MGAPMQDSRARSEQADAPAASGVVEGGQGGATAGDDAILDDVLVEDVSIDGMCGVY